MSIPSGLPFPPELSGTSTNFVLLGEGGCGKSEIAVNLALALLRRGDRPVHFFDLDMTKPLFRSRDHCAALSEQGIQFHFEEQFMDAPTLVGGVRRLLLDENAYVVMDVGGDYIGARSIGGYATLLRQSGAALYYVLNPFRPWSMTLEHIDMVLGETLGVSHLPLDAVHFVGNPNLGVDTTAKDVTAGLHDLSELVVPYKPILFFCAEAKLIPELQRFPYPLFPLQLYFSYPWREGAGQAET